jgi:hypothetical protein
VSPLLGLGKKRRLTGVATASSSGPGGQPDEQHHRWDKNNAAPYGATDRRELSDSGELVQESFRVFQVGGVKALGEPAV